MGGGDGAGTCPQRAGWRVRSPLSTFSTHFPGIGMKAGFSPMLPYDQGENVTRTRLLAVRIQRFDTHTAMW